MPNWTRRQQLAFLAYLLLLNMVVLGGLAYLLFTLNFSAQSQPTPAIVAALTPTVTATRTPFPLPTLRPTRSAHRLVDHLATPTLTHKQWVAQIEQSLIVPFPKPYPDPQPLAEMSEAALATKLLPPATLASLILATPTPLPTPTPSPTPIAKATFTPTTHPTRQPAVPPTAKPVSTEGVIPVVRATSGPGPTITPSAVSSPWPTATATKHAVASLTSPVSLTSPLPVAALALLDNQGEELGPLAAFDRLPASLAEARSVSENRIALSWLGTSPSDYRIYSDMGSGYDVYIFKAQTNEASYLDTVLRPDRIYAYQISQVSLDQEPILAQIRAKPLSRLRPDSYPDLVEPDQAVTVSPRPTALPADTILLGLLSDNRFIDDFEQLTIAGEVRNDSNLEVGHTKITVTFYNQAGLTIGATQGQTLLKVIRPGETSPFLITLPRPDGMVSHSLAATARPVSPTLPAQLAIVEVRRFEDEAGFFHIKGTVENQGTTTAKRVKIAATIYNRDGRVINIGFTSPQPANLAPGDRANYDIVFTYYPRYFSQVVLPFEE